MEIFLLNNTIFIDLERKLTGFIQQERRCYILTPPFLVKDIQNSNLLFSFRNVLLNRVASVLSNAFAVFIQVRSELFVFRVAESDA